MQHIGPMADQLWQNLARRSKGCHWCSLANSTAFSEGRCASTSTAKWQLQSKEDLRRYCTPASRHAFLPIPAVWQPFVAEPTSSCSVRVKPSTEANVGTNGVCLLMAFGVCRGEQVAAEVKFDAAVTLSSYKGCFVGVEAMGQSRSLTFIFEPVTGQCSQVLHDSSGEGFDSCANLTQSLLGGTPQDMATSEVGDVARSISASIIISDSGSISFLRRVGNELQAEACGEVMPANGAPWVSRYYIFAKVPIQTSAERTVSIKPCLDQASDIAGKELEAVWKAPNIREMEELEAGVGLEHYDTLRQDHRL